MSVVDVVNGSDHRRVISMAQMIDIQGVTDLPDAVFHIQASSAVRIGLFSDRELNLVRDVFDKAGRFMVDRRFYCPASGVSHYHHKVGSQVFHRVFDAAQLVVVDHIAGQADREQFAAMTMAYGCCPFS